MSITKRSLLSIVIGIGARAYPDYTPGSAGKLRDLPDRDYNTFVIRFVRFSGRVHTFLLPFRSDDCDVPDVNPHCRRLRKKSLSPSHHPRNYIKTFCNFSHQYLKGKCNIKVSKNKHIKSPSLPFLSLSLFVTVGVAA